MADRIERLTCYLCSAEIPLQGPKRRVKDEKTGRWHDEEEEPAPSFVIVPLYKDGRLLLDQKGRPVPAYLCHRCGVEEPPDPDQEVGQQRLL